MSRGPGRLQRELLAALDERPVVVVREVTVEVADGVASRPQHVAARSAAHGLDRVGLARTGYLLLPVAPEARLAPQLVMVRPDDPRELWPVREAAWASKPPRPTGATTPAPQVDQG